MLSKHKVGTPMSGLLAVKRGFGLLAFLLIGLAANAGGGGRGSPAGGEGTGLLVVNEVRWAFLLLIGLAAIAIGLAAIAYAELGPNTVPPNAVAHVPEIAVGAGISAFVLAGGGLLLLADRLRGKKKSKS